MLLKVTYGHNGLYGYLNIHWNNWLSGLTYGHNGLYDYLKQILTQWSLWFFNTY